MGCPMDAPFLYLMFGNTKMIINLMLANTKYSHTTTLSFDYTLITVTMCDSEQAHISRLFSAPNGIRIVYQIAETLVFQGFTRFLQCFTFDYTFQVAI